MKVIFVLRLYRVPQKIKTNSTSLWSSLDQLDVRTPTSVQTFDFSTLYTSIPHDLLKSRISNLVHNAFKKKDGRVRYTHIKVIRAKGHLTRDIYGDGDNMETADKICKMIEFLIFCAVWRASFPSGNCDSSGNELCSITC